MSGAIGPGDWVEALHGPWCPGDVVKGQLYLVDTMEHLPAAICNMHPGGCDQIGLTFSNHPIPEDAALYRWCANCFRPVYRPREGNPIQAMRLASEQRPSTNPPGDRAKVPGRVKEPAT